jgi:surface antigen
MKRFIVFAGLVLIPACTEAPGVGGDIGAMIAQATGQNLDPATRAHLNRAATKTGAAVEKSIFGYLSELNQAQMATATARAVETGRTQTWHDSSSGASGSATPPTDSPPGPDAGDSCREVEQTVTLPDGRTGTQRVRACKRADGRWDIEEI